MGKVKIAIYCCLIADVFTKGFTEKFLEKSSTLHMNLSKNTEFDLLPWQTKRQIYENKILKKKSSAQKP